LDRYGEGEAVGATHVAAHANPLKIFYFGLMHDLMLSRLICLGFYLPISFDQRLQHVYPSASHFLDFCRIMCNTHRFSLLARNGKTNQEQCFLKQVRF